MRIDLAGWAREPIIGNHEEIVGMFERADKLGFDCVWFNEFHFSRDGVRYPSTLLLGAALLARTERIRFGTSVLLLALYHPLLLAEQVAQLDYQSGGRLDVGIGRGTMPPTLTALELDTETLRPRFEQAFTILRQAWQQPAVSASGPFWNFKDVPVGPPPVQRPHPPLYVAGYTEETIAFAAEHDLPLLLSLEPPELKQLQFLRKHLPATRRSDTIRRSSLSRHLIVRPTASDADALTDTLLHRLNERRSALARQRGTAVVPLTREALLRQQLIAGTPQSCFEQIEALVQATGIENLRCYFNGNGVLSNEIALAGMELFAREILPTLRQVSAPTVP